jgi:outer membrane protein OmpA-like peptidoglycan-associated protein
MRTLPLWPAAAIAALTIAACSRDNTAAAKTADTSTSTATTAATRAVCAMVTAEEMSGIVGTKLSAESGDSTATCKYQPAQGSSPHVELTVDWGGGPAALTASSLLSRREPGISSPLDGLGDEASSIGPALWVRVGEDLVTLTLWGIEEDIPAAKRIIATMRPRMGPSAQAKSGNTSSSDEAAKAGAIVSGLLDRLTTANQGARAFESGGTAATSPAAGTATPIADEASYGPAKGSSMRIPLIAGLTLIGAEQEPGRGDYEPIVTITAVVADAVSTTFSTTLPEGGRLRVERSVSRDDLWQARAFRSWYEEDDPPRFAGATSFSVSAAVLNDLKTKGQADVIRLAPRDNSLASLAQRFAGGNAASPRQDGTLHRIEAYAVAFPVLVNDTPVELPAIHARGTFNGAAIDFHVLDDPDNPLLLRLAGGSAGRIVRIAFPTSTSIEAALTQKPRVELHGIYFDSGKATIRPESEPVLREIAGALTHNPHWRITIEGHTDNIGGDAANLDLSHRRADAVRQALVERYRVPAATLATNGFGAARPSAPNDTLSGRARNRRVELVRQ